MNAIDISQLHKSFDGRPVLRGLDLHVPAGRVYGLVGANGAGKSTLLRVVLGFLRPDQGVVRVLGTPHVEQVRGRVGYLPERLRYHLRFSAREYLRYLGRFNDMREPALSARIDEELHFFDLSAAADQRLSTYSKGMLQRFGIAQALLHDPELVLVDEPTSGLDPAGQREMLNVLAATRQRGHSILLTTHMLQEVEYACDTVGILANGQIAFESDVAALQQPGRDVAIMVPPLPSDVVARLLRLSPAVRYAEREVTIAPNSQPVQAEAIRVLLDANVPIIALEPRHRVLEEIYMRVTRGEAVNLPALPTSASAMPAAAANGLFAPPGHPDALAREQVASDNTLLHELLHGKRGAE